MAKRRFAKFPSDPRWTPEEIKEFDRLIEGVSSRNQATRSTARFAQRRFVEIHGSEKCDAMWAALEGKPALGDG